MGAMDRATLLIVDDDPALRRTLQLRLREEGFRVLEADSAERALALLAVELPDLLITDVRMGGMDGLALFDEVRRSHPLLPVVIVTAHGSIPDAVEVTRKGVFAYLTKPVEAAELLAQVRRALAVAPPAAQRAGPARGQIVTRSAAMRALLDEAEQVAATDAAVLIHGETGTGKELLAQAIHDASARRDGPFVAVNCGAIPEALLESELFGHVRGAFTGAQRDHPGLIRSAAGGTLFLDEVGDMPLALQVKLLRVLQERQVRPVGGTRALPVDVRIVAATHRDLDAARRDGSFRDDLYWRLAVVVFTLPPLRERREDIPALAQHFLAALAGKYRKPLRGFAPDAMALLARAPWPGNVRQLFNAVEKCVALAGDADSVGAALVERAVERSGDDGVEPFDEARRRFERDYLVQLLRLTGGNAALAARLAQRNRTDFYALLARHHLEPGAFRAGSGPQ
ncbi:sigma 54-interacting transcriptional regulator [Azohydromonas sp.]|uniref:sigma 54-interacting transcriptional regulator n=1 Tax=Azohydromonas sp. TaxID=1872666 RepID=UPI002C8E29D1|nr:sigma 54-interacting transcriptional regulator [Azohydromonas sp.]HMM86667.1 sigma 54-interacting transcriptional regulator [Azohydromonas sp.]